MKYAGSLNESWKYEEEEEEEEEGRRIREKHKDGRLFAAVTKYAGSLTHSLTHLRLQRQCSNLDNQTRRPMSSLSSSSAAAHFDAYASSMMFTLKQESQLHRKHTGACTRTPDHPSARPNSRNESDKEYTRSQLHTS